MIDIHSHVLPGMDDGSRSTAESLAMLRTSALQGITVIAATPHFYPEQNDPEKFLLRRAASVERLREEWEEGLPKLIPGAEVAYFEGISRAERIRELCLEGTNLLLLEMPFGTWTERMAKEVQMLGRQYNLRVLLAHVERYRHCKKASVWDELLAGEVAVQCNAEFFIDRWTKRRARHMLERGEIQLIGSDCHNMKSRVPNMGEALKTIGENGRRILEKNSQALGLIVEKSASSTEGDVL